MPTNETGLPFADNIVSNYFDGAKSIVKNNILVGNHTNNINLKNTAGILNNIGATSTFKSVTGMSDTSFITTDQNPFSTTPFTELYRSSYAEFVDFRSRFGVTKTRNDGASAAARGSKKSLMILGASKTPGGGLYSIFNLNAGGQRGYGWGSHGDPDARIYRTDFTLQSNVTTKWLPSLSPNKKGTWVPKILNQAVPFRGDRVSVIDFSQRNLNDVYRWKPKLPGKVGNIALGAGSEVLKMLNPNYTQDFIKFYFTGPKLANNSDAKVLDDILVFRAIITQLSDSFMPSYSDVQMMGRADTNYHYNSFSRSMSLGFIVYATDRDELKPIWRKLNALAGYTAPTYIPDTIGMAAPWMRITIGDLLIQQPILIDSLQFDLHDQDTSWEINFEKDPEMKQAPIKVSVTMGIKVITEYLPEKGGRFYTLSDNNMSDGTSKRGSDNWLSDSNGTYEDVLVKQRLDAYFKDISNKYGFGK